MLRITKWKIAHEFSFENTTQVRESVAVVKRSSDLYVQFLLKVITSACSFREVLRSFDIIRESKVWL